ncbi:hypothetical protein [Alkaliphilus serpentinus]|uniref:Uncharacterized protein n=1 Tax=Alkaliphilus serpentinus TaxID=1482731 RepID=A0A833HPH6_9FIRM|nr:hypothetical protein [Alkaliphilus serpentinus]KAB3530722.1 hypothetical protein F8153_06330 [Alkaliphilus serpentinus]
MTLIAQNGLEYTVDLIFTIPMATDEFKVLQLLIGNLVKYTYKISDEGIIVIYTLNVDAEIAKMGRFKDVPSVTEIKKYMPLVVATDTFMKSDLVFSNDVINYYIDKEAFNGKLILDELKQIQEKLQNTVKNPTIKITNLILNKRKKLHK